MKRITFFVSLPVFCSKMKQFLWHMNRNCCHSVNFKFILIWCILSIFITGFILINENLNKHKHFKNQSPMSSDFDVVLNYYNENITFVAQFIRNLRNISIFNKFHLRIIVYNKNTNITVKYLRTVLQVDLVYQLLNIGRESDSYLYHIINNYDRLTTHIFFCQAGAQGFTGEKLESWFIDRLEKQFNQSVGYMPMIDTNSMAIFDCGEGRNENVKQLGQLWGIIEQTLCPPIKQAVTIDNRTYN